jgi:predicted HicB family RNase H-like nuclease
MNGAYGMSNIMRYKGYAGTVEYSAEDKLFFGEIAFINDTVLFEGETVKELETNFKDSVNHYIETCKKTGKEPQKAFKGLFPDRINPEIHKKAALVALQRKMSLNKLVELAIKHEIEAAH